MTLALLHFNTATPDKAINPIPAEIENGIDLIYKATTPPVKANGIPLKTIRLFSNRVKSRK